MEKACEQCGGPVVSDVPLLAEARDDEGCLLDRWELLLCPMCTQLLVARVVAVGQAANL